MLLDIKKFIDLLAWVNSYIVKKHPVTKIGVFIYALLCVGMLGKSTNYSTGSQPFDWGNFFGNLLFESFFEMKKK